MRHLAFIINNLSIKVLALIILFAILPLSGCIKAKKTQKDSNMSLAADTIEPEKDIDTSLTRAIEASEVAESAEQLAKIEAARRDSIRQDSIEEEERMRVTYKLLTPYEGIPKVKELKKLGFKLKYEKTGGQGAEYGLPSKEGEYERIFNGRKITYIYSTCDDVREYFYFEDKRDFDFFLKDLKMSTDRGEADAFTPEGAGLYVEKDIKAIGYDAAF